MYIITISERYNLTTLPLQGKKRKGPGRPKKHPMILESDNEESEIVSLMISSNHQCSFIFPLCPLPVSLPSLTAVHSRLHCLPSLLLHLLPGTLSSLLSGIAGKEEDFCDIMLMTNNTDL